MKIKNTFTNIKRSNIYLSMNLILISTILAYVGIIIGYCISFTKIFALVKFQDVERSNIPSSIISILTSLIWLFYAIILNSLPLILSAVSDILMDFIIILLTYYFIWKKTQGI